MLNSQFLIQSDQFLSRKNEQLDVFSQAHRRIVPVSLTKLVPNVEKLAFEQMSDLQIREIVKFSHSLTSITVYHG